MRQVLVSIFSLFVSLAFGIKLRPINIALAVDDHSAKDIAVLVNSVLETAENPSEIKVHVVACGRDMIGANVLKHSIEGSLSACFPALQKEVVAFVLPADSGFAAQLEKLKTKASHWNSQCGADMARFFLPSLFPKAGRILYLDNDIIVGCCIEEIFDTEFTENQVVGLALDDLNWATVTQFQRHYNASHPLVIKNMRRANPSYGFSDAVTKEEFSKDLPKYPNDGVILIDVEKYNRLRILESMDEIAAANGRGEYAVNLGTQQFTVLTLFDRWAELSPRANLRHFPDMARGYLMWFYYNGFIHYAGQAKPRNLCLQGNYKDNWLRVQSYTAWAHSNRQVSLKCGFDKLVYADACVAHIPLVRNMTSFLQLLGKIMAVSRDDALVYARVGALHGDLTAERHTADDPIARFEKLEMSSSGGVLSDTGAWNMFLNSSSTAGRMSSGSRRVDLVELVDRYALHKSSWSLRNYNCHLHQWAGAATAHEHSSHGKQLEHCQSILNKALATMESSPSKPRKGSKKNEKPLFEQPKDQIRFGTRNFVVKHDKVCHHSLGEERHDFLGNLKPNIDRKAPSNVSGEERQRVGHEHCVELLDDVRNEGKKHWDVVAITVDMDYLAHYRPHHSIEAAATSATAGDCNHAAYTSLSVQVLHQLDLVFMRPKLIVVRVGGITSEDLELNARATQKFISRHGFVVTAMNMLSLCDGGPTVSEDQQGREHSSFHFFTCLIGTRLNTFEIADVS